jgi:hypothetical protein
MDQISMTGMEQMKIEPRWGGFLLLVVVFSLGIYAMLSIGDYKKIKENWPKYRCMPHIMPFASVYGENTSDNFNYCMKNMFTDFGGEMLAPFYGMISFFTKTLMGLLNNINSLRVMLASLVGGITTIFSEFTERLSMFFFHIRMSATRMRQLMNRVVGIMFSIMYMGMSGIMSAVNFGDTVLFRFLDTFCFAPETLVEVDGRGKVPISSIKIGDYIGGNKVNAVFSFLADGQPMRVFENNGEKIIVSTNHYIEHNQRWIEVADHPDAVSSPDWSGGTSRPLICLNIEGHRLPIGSYVFCDYDEIEEGDKEAMAIAEQIVNGSIENNGNNDNYNGNNRNQKSGETQIEDYSPGFFQNTLVKMAGGGVKEMKDVQLGDKIANGGKVVGIVRKEINEYCLYNGDIITPSTLVWHGNAWVRAGTIVKKIDNSATKQFYNLFVSPHSCIETASGNMYRDYIEVMSPAMRDPYSKRLTSDNDCLGK